MSNSDVHRFNAKGSPQTRREEVAEEIPGAEGPVDPLPQSLPNKVKNPKGVDTGKGSGSEGDDRSGQRS